MQIYKALHFTPIRNRSLKRLAILIQEFQLEPPTIQQITERFKCSERTAYDYLNAYMFILFWIGPKP